MKKLNEKKENKTMKNINWSSIKTNVIVFLVAAVVFTIHGWNLHTNQQSEINAKATAISELTVKAAKNEAADTPSKQ